MRIRSLMPVVGAAIVAASCQAKPSEPAAPPAAEPQYTTTATIKDIMLHIVDPAGDLVWDSVSTVIDKQGMKETVPTTDEDWFKVRSGVITLIEASNLLQVPGRAMARPGEKSVAPGVELEPSEMEEMINKDRATWNMRATAQNRQPAWSPQATPRPVLKAACTLGWFSTMAAAVSKAPIRLTGLSGSAKTKACSGVSER